MGYFQRAWTLLQVIHMLFALLYSVLFTAVLFALFYLVCAAVAGWLTLTGRPRSLYQEYVLQ